MSNKLNYAIGLAIGAAFISGTNNFLTKIAVTAVKDPVVFTFLKNGIVALFLIGLFIMLKKWHEVRTASRSDLIKLALIGVIGGSIPFILYFTGLTMIPALTASFIHKTLFIWVAILAIPFLKERIGMWPAVALLALFGGNALLGLPRLTLGTGELLVLAATIFWAVENIIAKKALKNLSSLTVAGARMALGSLIILAVVAFQGNLGLLDGLSTIQWGWTLLTAALLLGYVLTWYTALKYAPATLVASILVLATFVTNALNAIFITHTLSEKQLASGLLLMVAVTILSWKARSIAPKRIKTPLPTPIILQ